MHFRSHAKINLYLDVLEKRDDGFHNIETIFQTISLSDSLECEPHDSEISLSVQGADLPTDNQNLVIRSAQLLKDRYQITLGARLSLQKSIPIAAGLAGGSGNAAATLIALNTLWDINAPLEDLQVLAAELGSDIPYCLLGGTMAGTSRGEILTPLAQLPETWFILAHPPVEVSTVSIYNHPNLIKSGGVPQQNGRTQAFDKAIEKCASGDIEAILHNTMESAALTEYPVIAEYKEKLRAAGCLGVLMSGSGPTVFGLCRDNAHALEVQASLDGIQTSVVHTVNSCVESV